MAFAHGHALMVGVSSHQYHSEVDIPISVRDVQAVAAVLQDENACGYPPAQLLILHDDAATREGILKALDKLAIRTTSESTIFLFYCGHGAWGTDGNYHLFSHDVQLQDGRIVAGTGVSEAELLEKLRVIKAQRLMIIIDACYSGHISSSRGAQAVTRHVRLTNPPEETAMALLSTGSGRIIITSCRESQVSYIGIGMLSIFTQALVDCLRGKGVRNNQGMISAFGLYEQLYAIVRDVVAAQIQAVQEPELTVLKGVGPFAVALYKGASSLGDFEPEPVPQGAAVREVPLEKSAKYVKQDIVSIEGGTHVRASVQVKQGDFVGRDKIVHDEEVEGDKVQGNKIGGDNISVGNISGSQGIAIGRNASARVTSSSMSSIAKIDPQELRAVLEELWEALGTAQLPREQTRITQTAVSNAIDSVGDEEANSTTAIEDVKKIGEILKQTGTVIQEGSSLWQNVLRLAQVVGPVVGGGRIVAGWFGIPF